MGAVAETTQIAARVPVELADALGRIADDNDRSASAELRIALKAHVEKHTPKEEAAALSRPAS